MAPEWEGSRARVCVTYSAFVFLELKTNKGKTEQKSFWFLSPVCTNSSLLASVSLLIK